jgi:nitroimidazol reductase NimA-like FMN-containing flavoprotein (pyridoxamine 5'-phosphate oxidase superfamily)
MTVNGQAMITDRTTVRRLPARGDHRWSVIHAVLDEALVAHVGLVHGGSPVVIPMAFARVGERLYLHGSPASRLLRSMRRGAEVCVTVTLIDGLVLARSAFHHSVNYRSVVVYGAPAEVTDPDEKGAALAALVERAQPGRSSATRPPNPKELAGTLVVSVGLEEASAKIRTGPPIDDEEDYALDVWAGEIPLRLSAGAPVPDPRLAPGIPFPGPTSGRT